MNNILILTSGKVSKLDSFSNDIDKASFNDVTWNSMNNDLRIMNNDIKKYKVIYFRVVGKSLEIASLVARYAKKNNIKIIDSLYEDTSLMPASLAKSIEMQILQSAGVPIPKTVFNKFDELDYPFVVKSTTSSRAREVWLVRSEIEMRDLREKKFEKGKFYFAQEFIPNSNRIRALVIGDKVVGAIKRHTKWNKDETKETLNPVPKDMADLSLTAAHAMKLDICGVDLLTNETGKLWVIEANAAPTWKLINKYCGVKIEDEIIKFIQTKI